MSFLIKGIEALGNGIKDGAIGVGKGIEQTAVGGAKFVAAAGEGVAAGVVCIGGTSSKGCKTLSKLAAKNIKEGPLEMLTGPFAVAQGVIDGTIGAAVAGSLVTVGELAKDVGLPGVGNVLESKEVEAIVNIAATVAVTAVAAAATGGASVLLEGAAATEEEMEAARTVQEAADFLAANEDAAAATTESVGSAASNAADIAADEGSEASESAHKALEETEEKFSDLDKDASKPEPTTKAGRALRAIKKTAKFLYSPRSLLSATALMNSAQWLAFLTCQSLPLGFLTPDQVRKHIAAIPLMPFVSALFDSLQQTSSKMEVWDDSKLNQLSVNYAKACETLLQMGGAVTTDTACDVQQQIDGLLKSTDPKLSEAIKNVKDARKALQEQRIQAGGLSDRPLLKGSGLNPDYNLEKVEPYKILTDAKIPQIRSDPGKIQTLPTGRFVVCMKFTYRPTKGSNPPQWVSDPRWYQLNGTWTTLITLNDAYLHQFFLRNNSDAALPPDYKDKRSMCVMTTFSNNKLQGGWTELQNAFVSNTPWEFFHVDGSKVSQVKGTITPCLTQGGDYTDPLYTGPIIGPYGNCAAPKSTIDGIGFVPFSSLWQTFFVGSATECQYSKNKIVTKNIPLKKGVVVTLVGGDQTMGKPTEYPNWKSSAGVPMVYTIDGVPYVSRELSVFSLDSNDDSALNISPAAFQYIFQYKDPSSCLRTIKNAKAQRGWELYSHLRPTLLNMKKRHNIYKNLSLLGATCIIVLVANKFLANNHPIAQNVLVLVLVLVLVRCYKAGLVSDIRDMLAPAQ